ncbi:MAG TPA: NAD(P)-dependent oxidoreductase [Gemmatimonadales bacterium]|nr:NAD(P)-dependent oxidoreductase [Gemmatimonadales bacterium]
MKIGFAGLGAIGTPMAARLAAASTLTVWNRTAARAEAFVAAHPGTRMVAHPAALARDVDAVITCLPTSIDVAATLDGPEGLLTTMPSGAILIDCTSGDPATSRSLASRLAKQGIGFVDAPVSGGPPLASTGQLTVMCGGTMEDVTRARAIVAPFAAKVIHMGPVGAGHAMKAVNNALLAINILAAAEGLVALAKAGIAPRDAVEVLNASSGRSFATEVLVPDRVLTGSYPPLFRLALLEKDIGIAHQVARDAGTADPVLGFVREQFRALRAELGETADYLDPVRRAERRAGVELRG